MLIQRVTRNSCTLLAVFALLFCVLNCNSASNTLNSARNSIAIVTGDRPTAAVSIAAEELGSYLSKLYPDQKFAIAKKKSNLHRCIYLGAMGNISCGHGHSDLKLEADGYAVVPVQKSGRNDLCIIGSNDRAVLYGVYGLLEELGCGFYISFETLGEPKSGPVSFEDWGISNAPLVKERIIFNWHNFLTGCSAWDKSDWFKWIEQSQKMGLNTIMLHAYGNNPMFTFEFNGLTKPVGYMSSSNKGRQWGNTNINDVRRLPAGDVISDGSFFGSEAALVSDNKRIESAQSFMQDVLKYAAMRDMKINFSYDIDDITCVPQDLVMTLPEADRFVARGIQMARPDTEKGYGYYKAELEGMLKLYPQIDVITLWSNTLALYTEPNKLPEQWQAEYKRIVSDINEPNELGNYGPQAFMISKIIAAKQRALKELGREDIKLATGSWYTDRPAWIEASVLMIPKDIRIIALDYMVLNDISMIGDKKRLETLQRISKGRVIPITWSNHDDGKYMGRPVKMFSNFHDRLEKIDAPGFGIIHWTQRPYDIFFKSHARQVWLQTRNEQLSLTVQKLAADCCGEANKELIADVLQQFNVHGPCFGRGTQDPFFFHGNNEGVDDPATDIAGCKIRLMALEKVDTSVMTEKQKTWLDYFRTYEKSLIYFCQAQDIFQKAHALILDGKHDEAAKILPDAKPEKAIAEYAKLVRLMPDDKGQKAMVLRLGYAWWGDFVCLRQMAGLEPVRIKFGPTMDEPLARGDSIYTNFIDLTGALWRSYGEYEFCGDIIASEPGTGTWERPLKESPVEAFTFPDPSKLKAPKNFPPQWLEISHDGIIVKEPATFYIRPINRGFPHGYNETPGNLKPGNYTLTLITARKNPGKEPCYATVKITPKTEENSTDAAPVEKRIELAASTTNAKTIGLETFEIGFSLDETGEATLEIIPAIGEPVFCGFILKYSER